MRLTIAEAPEAVVMGCKPICMGLCKRGEPGTNCFGTTEDVVRLRPNYRLRVFKPASAKHSKSFLHIDGIAVGIDPVWRNFEPRQIGRVGGLGS